MPQQGNRSNDLFPAWKTFSRRGRVLRPRKERWQRARTLRQEGCPAPTDATATAPTKRMFSGTIARQPVTYSLGKYRSHLGVIELFEFRTG
jgi:hypothetical protein